jgi:peptidoglycan hydrolase-like protein with peptidoglycan-binding domain
MKTTAKGLLAITALCGCLSVSAARAATDVVSGDVRITPVIVAAMQEQLKEGGFYSARVDGDMDAKTHDALARFQSANGLTPTGEANGVTLDALGITEIAAITIPPPSVAASVAPEAVEPAAGGSDIGADTGMSKVKGFLSGLFKVEPDPRMNTPHENGASCMTCTNGIIGNAGTASMRSNEY